MPKAQSRNTQPAAPIRVRWRTHYATIPDALLRARELSRNARQLWCILASYVGRNETAWPYQETLAEDMAEQDADGNLNVPHIRSIQRWTKELEIHNWLIIHKTGRNNDYELIEKQVGTPIKSPSPPSPPPSSPSPVVPQHTTPVSPIEINRRHQDQIRGDTRIGSDLTPGSPPYHINQIHEPPSLNHHHHGDDDGVTAGSSGASGDPAGDPSPRSAAPLPPTATEQLLAEKGITAAHEFAHLDYAAVAARLDQLGSDTPRKMIVANLRRYPPTLTTRPATAPTAPTSTSERPDWIADETWQNLPPRAQGLLQESRLVNGQIICSDPTLNELLTKYYSVLVARLTNQEVRHAKA